ncbi:hypothetical protein [Streptomyces sp. NPDC051567]|uniref:hypothetical protein n=1 Tax=Streptomyces sp. NPDC051567 TaxID=3365660 RepID=UPI0037968B1A
MVRAGQTLVRASSVRRIVWQDEPGVLALKVTGEPGLLPVGGLQDLAHPGLIPPRPAPGNRARPRPTTR